MIICQKCMNTFDERFLTSKQILEINRGVNNPCPINHCHGSLVNLDLGIYPIIKNLWDNQIDTIYSCEGHMYENNTFMLPYIVLHKTISTDIRHELDKIINDGHNLYIDYERFKNYKFNNDQIIPLNKTMYDFINELVNQFNLKNIYIPVTAYANTSIEACFSINDNGNFIFTITAFPDQSIIKDLDVILNEFEYIEEYPYLKKRKISNKKPCQLNFVEWNEFKADVLIRLYIWSSQIVPLNYTFENS